jgi:L-lactate dehydrogenase complex protein LldG
MTNTSREAREAILQSIRSNLAASEGIVHGEHTIVPDREEMILEDEGLSMIERFRERLQSVGGFCDVVESGDEATRALAVIVSDLQSRNAAKRIALSDAQLVSSLARGLADQIDVCPSPAELFNYDVGITMAQAAIAETGTLVLVAETERHRLVSLLPPVHIAIVYARDIVPTIGDALSQLHGSEPKQMSRAITFITGPSRTADIELTLTVGVHGPKELRVIVINNGRQ